MSPEALVVGMCVGITGLVTVLCAWMAHDADQRRAVAETLLAETEARLRETELSMVNCQRAMVNEREAGAGGEVVLWTEWSGWKGWIAAQTVVDGHRILVWFN